MIVDRTDPGPRVARHHATGRGVTRVAYPIEIRHVVVSSTRYVTPEMLRVTVTGAELDGLHTYQADDHVRLVFPDADGRARYPEPDGDMLHWPTPMPPSRKYTIRRYDADARELDLDFVVHPGGLASEWATGLRPGDSVAIAGPPGAKAFAHTYRHYVFAVDDTALPAVARWLDESAVDVSADVVVETASVVQHAYPLAERDGVRVHWSVRGERSALAETVQSLAPLPDDTFLFAAGEAGDLAPLRAWSKTPSGPADALFTGYWRRGVADHDE